jgi:hypothetical protein
MTHTRDERPGERIAWFWERPSAADLDTPSPLREPARLVTVSGCVILAFTAVMPHAEGIIPGLPDVALRFIPDSGFLLIAAVALALLVGRRATAESGQWVFRVLPVVLGITIVATWLNMLRLSQQAIADWVGFRGSGHLTWIFLMGGVASAVVALGAIWVVLSNRRPIVVDMPTVDQPEALRVTPPTPISRIVAGAIGTVGGAILGLAAVATVLQGSVILPLLAAFGAFYGGMVGSWVGAAVGRRLERPKSPE